MGVGVEPVGDLGLQFVFDFFLFGLDDQCLFDWYVEHAVVIDSQTLIISRTLLLLNQTLAVLEPQRHPLSITSHVFGTIDVLQGYFGHQAVFLL